mgnify:CR=1 FL=1
MSIKEMIEQAKAEGTAQFFVVYANIGNDSDELVVCEPEQADAEGAEVVDITYIEHNNHLRTMIITAEVK